MNLFKSVASSANPLVELVKFTDGDSDAGRIGFTLRMDYGEALVMVHDSWRSAVGGIPFNSYLLAATFDPEKFVDAPDVDRRVILLRVVGRAEIGTDAEHLRAITQYFQENADASAGSMEGLEPLTVNRMSWSGSRCRILGTFYASQDGTLRLGTDIEDVFATRMMRVYKPSEKALEQIVNYVDPDRKKRLDEESRRKGRGKPTPFQIGNVRYTSTQHMARLGNPPSIPVRISPVDFIARRTAVFGMTRTGKSNTTKTMVSQVALTSLRTDQPIGQLIFDVNGEYSNANQQDGGAAISTVFPQLTIRYRARPAPGFRDLRANFYDDLPLAIELIGYAMELEGRTAGSNDLKDFMSPDLEEPPQSDESAHKHWKRRRSIMRTILYRTDYAYPGDPESDLETVDIGEYPLSSIIQLGASNGVIDPGDLEGGSVASNMAGRAEQARSYFGLKQAHKSLHRISMQNLDRFWGAVRDIEWESQGYGSDQAGIQSGSKKVWLDSTERNLLSVLVGRSSSQNTPIIARSAIRSARDFHGARGSSDVAEDIVQEMRHGRIVILDLSVGSERIRKRLSEEIAKKVFYYCSRVFNEGKEPPNIALYVEEAHNLIGKTSDLTDIWPRIAKEGAKYGIALIYATQEPSSIHPNILANTENFFVTHLNNDQEIRALSNFYDFQDFAAGLKASQDVGFARIKTLSANFVTPTQILKFDPEEISAELATLLESRMPAWFVPLEEEAT